MSEVSVFITLPVVLISTVLLPTWYQSWGLNSNIIFGSMAISRALDIVIDPFIGYYAMSLLQLSSHQVIVECKKENFVQHMYETHLAKIDKIYYMYMAFGIIGLISLYICLSNTLLSAFSNSGVQDNTQLISDTYSVVVGCFYIILIACNSVVYILNSALGAITIAKSEQSDLTPNRRNLYSSSAASAFSVSSKTLRRSAQSQNSYSKYVPKSNKIYNKNLASIAFYRVVIVMIMYVVPILLPRFVQLDSQELPFECDVDKCVVHEPTWLETREIEIPAGFGLPCSYYTLYESSAFNYLSPVWSSVVNSTNIDNSTGTATLIPIYNATYWNITYSNATSNANANFTGFVFDNISYTDPASLYSPSNCMSSDAYLISPYCNCVNSCNSMCVNNSAVKGYTIAALVVICASGLYMLNAYVQYGRRRRSERTMFNSKKVMDHSEVTRDMTSSGTITDGKVADSEATVPVPAALTTNPDSGVAAKSCLPSQVSSKQGIDEDGCDQTTSSSYYLVPRTCYSTISTTYLSILDNRVFTTSALCWICDINIPILYVGLVKYIIDVVLLPPITVKSTSDTISAVADMGWSVTGNSYVSYRSVSLGVHSDRLCESVDLSNIVNSATSGFSSVPGFSLFDNPIYAVYNYASDMGDYYDFAGGEWKCDGRSVASVVVFMYLIGLCIGVAALRILLLLRLKAPIGNRGSDSNITPISTGKQDDASDSSHSKNENSYGAIPRITEVVREKALNSSAQRAAKMNKLNINHHKSNPGPKTGAGFVLEYVYAGLKSISNRTVIEVHSLSCGLSVCIVCTMCVNAIYFGSLRYDTSNSIGSKIGWCAFLAMLCGIPVGCKLHLHFVNLFNDVLPYDTFIQNVGYFNAETVQNQEEESKKSKNGAAKRMVTPMDVYQSRLPIYLMFLVLIPKLSTLISYWAIVSGMYMLGYNKANDTSSTNDEYWLLVYMLGLVCGLTILLSASSLWMQINWYPIRFNKQREMLHKYLNIYKYNVKPSPHTRLLDPISGRPISVCPYHEDISSLGVDADGSGSFRGFNREKSNGFNRFRSSSLTSMQSDRSLNSNSYGNLSWLWEYWVSWFSHSDHTRYCNQKGEIQVVQEYYTVDEWKIVHILDYFLLPQHFEFMMRCLDSDRPEYIIEYSTVHARNTFIYGCGLLGCAVGGLYLYVSIYHWEEIYQYQPYFMSVGTSDGHFIFPMLLLFSGGIGITMMLISLSNYFLVDRLNHKHHQTAFNSEVKASRTSPTNPSAGANGVDASVDRIEEGRESGSDESVSLGEQNSAGPLLDLLTRELLQRMYCVRQYKTHMYYAKFMVSEEEVAQFIVNCNAANPLSMDRSERACIGLHMNADIDTQLEADVSDVAPSQSTSRLELELAVINEGTSDEEVSETEKKPSGDMATELEADQLHETRQATVPMVPKPPASGKSGNTYGNPYTNRDSVLKHTRSLLNSIRFTIKGEEEGHEESSEDLESLDADVRCNGGRHTLHHHGNAFQPEDDDVRELMDQYLTSGEHDHDYVEDRTKSLLTQSPRDSSALLMEMGFSDTIEKQTKALLEANWADDSEEEFDSDSDSNADFLADTAELLARTSGITTSTEKKERKALKKEVARAAKVALKKENKKVAKAEAKKAAKREQKRRSKSAEPLV